MEERESNDRNDRPEIFSKAVKAGKRTYFFDVKATREEELYLTITESKRRFNNESGKFFYEKHKLFLYAEDFEKFQQGLSEVIQYIETGMLPLPDSDDYDTDIADTTEIDYNRADNAGLSNMKSEFTDLDFEDLGNPPTKE